MRKITAVPISSKWCNQCLHNKEACKEAEGKWCGRFDPSHKLARKHFRERSGLE